MEKDQNKNNDSGTNNHGLDKWEQLGNVNGANTNATKTELDPHEAIQLMKEKLKSVYNKTLEDGLDDDMPTVDKEAETDTARELELIQAKELKLIQDKELELIQAKELENQQNLDRLHELTKEKIRLESQEDVDNPAKELISAKELENQQNLGKLHQLTRELTKEEIELEDQEKVDNPLTAINANWTHDRKEKAHDLAEQTLNAEVEKGNIITKIWKGDLLKKYYEKKYEKEFLDDSRTNKDGKTLSDIIREESPAVIERFVLSAVENEEFYLHGDEKLEKVDEETNEKIKHAIEKYARTKLKRGEKVTDDLDRKFENDINRILAKTANAGHTNNYLEVAKEAAERYKVVAENAKGKAEHEKAMALVMAGFQAYHADVRSGVRTEVHRDNIDKIVNAIESSKIGQFIPAEIVAGAAGAAIAFTQTGIRAAFGVAGGVFASGVISGLKERNRLAEDRARMFRDIASGKDYDSKNKKVAKHEQRIGGTLYDMQRASDLTDRINLALNPADGKINQKDLLSAIAEARVRIDFSDSYKKDLISYSSDQNRGKERLDLDIAVIKAEKALSEKSLKRLYKMEDHILDEITKSVDKKDKKFERNRTLDAMKKAGKTMLLGSAIFLGFQEAMAVIDPNKIGIFEKAGLLKKLGIETTNHTEAKETVLASGFGQFRGTYELPGKSNTLHVKDISDPSAIKKYEADGWTKIKVKDAWDKTVEDIRGVDPSVSTARVDVKYDGWASKGGLTANLENGKFVSTIKGAATINGKSVNYTPDQVKAFITIGDAKFEIAGKIDGSGQLTWGDNGVFETTTGETIKAIGDNGEKLYKYFEIATVNNIDGDGVQHIIPLATDVGKDTFSDKIMQVVELSKHEPAVYDFVKDIPGEPETFVRGITNDGFFATPVIAQAPTITRTGLGEAITPEPIEAEAPLEAPSEIPSETIESAPEVPEENIEVIPDVPEVTVPPEVLEENPEFANWENEIRSDIEDNINRIGEDGVAAMLDTSPYNDEAAQRRWRTWWSGLSDGGKVIARSLVNDILSSDYKNSLTWGNGFRTWLELQK